jgi:hypothetical protein
MVLGSVSACKSASGARSRRSVDRWPPRPAHAIIADPAALQGLAALQSLMDDCERMNRATLQWLTNCLTPWLVDRAVGDMKLDSQAGPQLATYVRYNVLLERDWLKKPEHLPAAFDPPKAQP